MARISRTAPTKTPTPHLSKTARLVALLTRPEGATLADLVDATGWQPHSVRGALAGTLKRKGYRITSEVSGGERRYRIEAPE